MEKAWYIGTAPHDSVIELVHFWYILVHFGTISVYSSFYIMNFKKKTFNKIKERTI